MTKSIADIAREAGFLPRVAFMYEDDFERFAAAIKAAHLEELQTPSMKNIFDQAVNRFLAWELPEDFYPDGYISFDKKKASANPHNWPTGTNLLHAGQARKMFEQCLTLALAVEHKTWMDELLAGVEMPEPYATYGGLNGDWSGLVDDRADHIAYCEKNPSEWNWWEDLFTLDQCQQAMAAAVARKNVPAVLMNQLINDKVELQKKVDALKTEFAKKDAEIQKHKDTLQDVRGHYERVCKERDALTAEFDALAAAVGWTKERCEQSGDSPIDCAKALTAERDKANQSSAHWQHRYTEVTAERDALREALEKLYIATFECSYTDEETANKTKSLLEKTK